MATTFVNTRTKCLIYLILVLIIFITTGCGALVPKKTILEGAARYGELERHMEEKVRTPPEANNFDLYSLCLSYSRVKRYNKLFPCIEEMQKRADRGDSKVVDLGMTIDDLSPLANNFRARALIELGDYSEAIVHSHNAYRVLKRINILNQKWRLSETLTLLGLAHALNGDREKAEKYVKELEGKTYRVILDTPAGIAKIYMALGDFDRALDALKRNDSGFEKAFAGAFLAVVLQVGDAWSWTDLPKDYMINKLLLETGEVTKAKEGFDNLLKVPQISENGDIYWMILFDRGQIAENEGDHKLTIELYSRAIEVIEEQRSTINTEVSKIGFVGDKQEVYSRIISLLFELSRYSEAFEYVERAKARALIDMLASRNQFRSTDGNMQEKDDLITKLDIAESETKIHNEIITSDQASKQRAIVIAIRQELRNADPELASLITVTPPDVNEIQQLLPYNETLVEYFGFDDSLFAFIVNRESVHGIKLNSIGLKQEIEKYRKHIMTQNLNKLESKGQTLYDKLIKPLEGKIGSKITIVPHGALHYLPFNALYSDNGFMIEHYSIRVLPSASVMKYLKDDRESPSGNLLAFGNPDLGDPKFDLPGAQNETIAITKGSPKSQLFLRHNATETAARKYGSRFRYLHFATHGTFDAEKPLSSGLLLSKDSENDGKLTVGELYDLNLPADLVTLSACETALGKFNCFEPVGDIVNSCV